MQEGGQRQAHPGGALQERRDGLADGRRLGFHIGIQQGGGRDRQRHPHHGRGDIQGVPVLPRLTQPRGMRRHHGGILREALTMKGRLQETALVLMPRAFAVEQPFPEKLFGHIPASAFLKGAVLPDEHRMQVLGMAEEHRAFRAEPEGDDIAVLTLETAHKAQQIAGKGQQMGLGNAFPGAGRHRCGGHTQSFCGGAAPRQRVASPRCGRPSQSPLRWVRPAPQIAHRRAMASGPKGMGARGDAQHTLTRAGAAGA